MTKKILQEKWVEATDKERLALLKEYKSHYTINVDNDDVFVTFSSDDEDDYLGFDEFGYDMLVIVLQYAGFQADHV